MLNLISPKSRVFHVARECYVVYLGSDRGDDRPFLRIGNSRELTDEIHQAISTTVIADHHVGNPLLEILTVSKYHGRYLGDTDIVEAMKRFFENFDLPTEKLTDYRTLKDGEGHHMVWFYSSGNIHLRYDNQVVFDLYKQEKQDRHFVRFVEAAKSEFLRNPFRYIKQDFSETGIILTHGNAFWFEAGELLSLVAHSGFVAKLMNSGVDPDLISTAICNLTNEELDSPDAAVYIGLLKRVRQCRKKIRVITSRPDLQRRLKLLFPPRGNTPGTLEVIDISGEKKAVFQESIISRTGGGWLIHHAGIPDVSFNSVQDNGLSVDIANGEIHYHVGTTDVIFDIPDGYPIKFVPLEVPIVQARDKYVISVLSSIKNNLQPEESEAVMALDSYFQIFHSDVLSEKTSLSPLLQQTANTAKDILKKSDFFTFELSWFYFYNVCTIISMLCETLLEDHPLSKNGLIFFDLLEAILKRIPSPNVMFPFLGDFHLRGNPVLLWRPVKRNSTPADFAVAQDVQKLIHQITSPDEKSWNTDRERLLKLIRSLRNNREGPLAKEQLALLSSREKEVESIFIKGSNRNETSPSVETRHPAKTRLPVEKKDPVSPKKPIVSKVLPGKSEGRKTEAVASPRSNQRKKKPHLSPWLFLAFIPLFMIGAILWDITGGAPWGRIFKLGALDTHTTQIETEISQDSDTTANNSATGTSPIDSEKISLSDENKSIPESDTNSTSNIVDYAENSPIDMEGRQASEMESLDDRMTTIIKAEDIPEFEETSQTYLGINDRVMISITDIHLAANEIAVLNGYKDLDYRVSVGADPDWIYPGNSLLLPHNKTHIVRQGDTIWFLATREIKLDIERDIKKYDQAIILLEDVGYSDETSGTAIDMLKEIARNSRAASLRNIAKEALSTKNL